MTTEKQNKNINLKKIRSFSLGNFWNNRLPLITLRNMREHYSLQSDVMWHLVFGNFSYTLTIRCLDLLRSLWDPLCVESVCADARLHAFRWHRILSFLAQFNPVASCSPPADSISAESPSGWSRKENSSRAGVGCRAWPWGGGVFYMFLSAVSPLHLWELQHVEIVHIFFIYIISFVDRDAILRPIFDKRIWCPPLDSAMQLSLISRLKGHKDSVYAVPDNLMSFKFSYDWRATFNSRHTCSPSANLRLQHPVHRLLLRRTLCAEAAVKAKASRKYSWDFPKCSHEAKCSHWKHQHTKSELASQE